jgi:hypothetical protein
VPQELEPRTETVPTVDGHDQTADSGPVEAVEIISPGDSVFNTVAVPDADIAPINEPATLATVDPEPVKKRTLLASDLPGRERRRRVRLQARRVRRIVRHIEPWSVLKISTIFFLCMWVIFMIAGVMLWGAAAQAGIIEKVENFVTELFALDDFAINADLIFRKVALLGFVLVIAGIAFTVLMSVLFNLISDLMGGLRVTVIEEESARFRPTQRRRQPRSPRQPGPTQRPPRQKRKRRGED